MGHFSRYLRPGMRKVKLTNLVETEWPPLSPADVKNGAALAFLPCEAGNAVQQFRLTGKHAETMGIVASGTDEASGSDGYGIGGECVEFCISGECWFPKVQLWACKQGDSPDPLHGGKGNQAWTINTVPGGSQLVNPTSGLCLTAVKAEGWAVGLDAGLTVTAAQAHPCAKPGSLNQTFLLTGDGTGDALSDGAVTISSALNGKCLQPQLSKSPHFDAVAFEHPDDGEVAMVVMNTNDAAIDITIKDETGGAAVTHSVPGHAIHSYRWVPEATPSSGGLGAARKEGGSMPAVNLMATNTAGLDERAYAFGASGRSQLWGVTALGFVAMLSVLVTVLRSPQAGRDGYEEAAGGSSKIGVAPAGAIDEDAADDSAPYQAFAEPRS